MSASTLNRESVAIVLRPLFDGAVKADIIKDNGFATSLTGRRQTVKQILRRNFPGVTIKDLVVVER